MLDEGDELRLEEAVGEGSSKGALFPVEATKALDELVVATLCELELDTVGEGSLAGTLPPVEAIKLLDELVVTAAADSTWELDSVEVVLAVGCTSLSGTPADDGRLPPKFSPPKPVRRSEVVVAAEEDAVGETMSSLLGMPLEGCWEELELGAVGETISSLLGIPTEGCCEELSLEVDGTSEEDVATLELEKVGCGSLLGTGRTDGCCPSLLPGLVLLLEVESGLDDDDSEELEKVGCTKKSGSPLEGVGITVASSVLGSYSSLLEVVGIVSEEELLKVG